MSFLTGRSVAGFDNLESDVTPPPSSTPTGSNESSRTQQVMFGAVAVGVAGYIVYNVWQNGRRTPTQRLNCATTDAHDNSEQEIFLVNFPEELTESMIRATKPFLGNVKLVPASAVMYDASGDPLTPAVVGGSVRQSTCAAFQQLGGKTPCVCYGEALAVGSESVNLFRSVDEVLRDYDRLPYLHRHCLGFTVDGSNVELIVHDVQGEVRRERYCAENVPEDTHMCRNELAVHSCFVPSTLTFEDDRVFTSSCNMSSDVLDLRSRKSVDRQAEKVDPSINTVWNSIFPLFALFGAVVQHNSANASDSDAWYPLSNRINGGRGGLAAVGALRFVPPALTRALQRILAPRRSHPLPAPTTNGSAGESPAKYQPRLVVCIQVRHASQEMRERFGAAFPGLVLREQTRPDAAAVELEMELSCEMQYSVPEAIEVLFHQAALVATVGGAVTRLGLQVVVERLLPADITSLLWPRDLKDRQLYADRFSASQYFEEDHVKVSDAVAFAWLHKRDSNESVRAEKVLRFVLAEFEC